jgi:hypothetical protein
MVLNVTRYAWFAPPTSMRHRCTIPDQMNNTTVRMIGARNTIMIEPANCMILSSAMSTSPSPWGMNLEVRSPSTDCQIQATKVDMVPMMMA